MNNPTRLMLASWSVVLLLFLDACDAGTTTTPVSSSNTTLPTSPPSLVTTPASPLVASPTPTRRMLQDEAAQMAWRADLQFLVEQLRQRHPKPFYRTSEADFQAAVDAFERAVPYSTRDQLVVGLARIAAMIDGHTQIPLIQFVDGHGNLAPSVANFHIYPLRLYDFSDGVFVIDAQDPYRHAIGARLVQIGRLTAEQAYPLLAMLAPHDNTQTIKLSAPLYHLIPEVLVAQGVADEQTPIAFVLEKPNGEKISITPQPITFTEYRRWSGGAFVGLPPQPEPLYLSRRNEAFWSTYLTDTQTLYVQYNQVRPSTQSGESLSAFSTRLAQTLADSEPKRVVVDLRHNGGGDNTTYGPLLNVLRSHPAFSTRGKLFTILGRQTFSAAANFATDLERHTTTLFAGEAMGGSPNLYGDVRPYTLPHSQLTVVISARYWPKSTPDDRRPSIEPQIPASLSSQDYFARRDPVLEAILRYR